MNSDDKMPNKTNEPHAELFAIARQHGAMLRSIVDRIDQLRDGSGPLPDEAEALVGGIWRFCKQYDVGWRIEQASDAPTDDSWGS